MQFELERIDRILEDLKKLRVSQSQSILDYKVREGWQEDGYCCDTDEWDYYRIDTPWTQLESRRWFRTELVIPEGMDGKRVLFRVTTGREGQWDATNPQLLCYVNGKIVGGIDVNHREVLLSDSARAGDCYKIALRGFSGSVAGDLLLHTDLIVVDRAIESFCYDLGVPLDSARILRCSDADNSRRILQMIAPAADCIDLRTPYSAGFYSSLSKAGELLQAAFYTKVNEQAPCVSGIGHTHIDIAWLWTVAETREKVLRSFATVLELMDRYPDYKFMSSQPILYQFVKEQEPELYARIKQRIDEGRWEVDGAMWLESDCNLPCGESLVRQIIRGEQFFMDEFGKHSSSLWLPDVFGYSAAIPQILQKCGIPYFMTTKIAWNQYNQLPNDTFIWQGIDGSRVFVFMPTTCDFDKSQGLNISFSDTRNTTTYTGIVNPNMVLGTYKRFQNKDLTEDTLMLFGYGDGGGGPTFEMLETAQRLKYGIPGIPRFVQEQEHEFFERTYNKIAGRQDMPTWNGELYFEYHRGTLTSIGRNKRNNRKSELLYLQLEALGAAASLSGGGYPSKTIAHGWDIILLNQFHDIIPGSAIAEVYEQTDTEYAEIIAEGTAQRKTAAATIASRLTTNDHSLVVFNTLGYTRNDIVRVQGVGFDVSGITDEQGNSYKVQYLADDSFIFFARGIPSMGCKSFNMVAGARPVQQATEWSGSYENDSYIASFNESMELTSLYCKEADIELLKQGRAGNRLMAYEDRPMNWDNWDIDIYYRRKGYERDTVSKVSVEEHGTVRTTLLISYGFSSSVVQQRVYLYRDIPRIDFDCTADWQEHNVLLKVNFPVSVNATRAAYEVQFGNVERETTSNTSWDTAKFETCGHKWADLSDNGAGLSLLNDCKYGYSIRDGEMELSLIKAGRYPHPQADIGQHQFTYSVYPHGGRWQQARTVEMAYNLNVPTLAIVPGKNAGNGAQQSEWSMVTVDKSNCFIESLKKAEDGNGYILRIYENHNKRTKTRITLGITPTGVCETDLLENKLCSMLVDKNSFEAVFAPFEIKSYRLVFN